MAVIVFGSTILFSLDRHARESGIQ
jgi:hypothetical protein